MSNEGLPASYGVSTGRQSGLSEANDDNTVKRLMGRIAELEQASTPTRSSLLSIGSIREPGSKKPPAGAFWGGGMFGAQAKQPQQQSSEVQIKKQLQAIQQENEVLQQTNQILSEQMQLLSQEVQQKEKEVQAIKEQLKNADGKVDEQEIRVKELQQQGESAAKELKEYIDKREEDKSYIKQLEKQVWGHESAKEDNMNTMVHEARQENKVLQVANEYLQKEVEQLKADKERLSADIDKAKQDEQNRYERIVNKIEADLEQKSGQLEESQKSKTALEIELQTIKHQVETSKEKIDQFTQQLEDAQKEKVSGQQQLETLQSDLSQKVELIAQHEIKIKEQSEKLELAVATQGDENQQLLQDYQQAQQQVEELQKQIKEESEKTQEHSSEFEKLNQELREAQADLERIKDEQQKEKKKDLEDLKIAEDNVKELENHVQYVQDKLDKSQQEQELLQDEVDDLKEKISRQEAASKAQEEISKKQIELIQSSKDELGTNLQEKSSELKEKVELLAQAQTELSEAKVQLQAAESKYKLLQEQSQMYQDQVSTVQSSMELQNSKVSQLTEENTQKQETIVQQTKEMLQLNKDIALLERQKAELDLKLEHQVQKYQEQQADVQQLKGKVDDRENKLKETEIKVHELNAEAGPIRQQVKMLEETISLMRSQLEMQQGAAATKTEDQKALNVKLEESNQKVMELLAERQETSLTLQKLQIEQSRLQANVQQMELSQQQQEVSSRSVDEMREKYNQQSRDSEEKIQKLSQQILDKDQQIVDLQKEITVLTDQNNTLKAAEAEFKNQLSSSNSDVKLAREQETRLKKQMEEQKAMIEQEIGHDWKSKLTEKEKKTIELQNQLQKAETQLQNSQSELDTLKQQCADLPGLVQRVQEQDKAIAEQTSKASELESKYISERKIRRELHEQLCILRGNIRVLVRCRPPFANKASCIQFPINGSVAVTGRDRRPQEFEFQAVFNTISKQEEVFQEVSPVIQSCMDGYNVCIFAYGQTGTGKTFTMQGTSEQPGIYLRTLEMLFALRQEGNQDAKSQVQFYVSLVEIYMEAVRDLLREDSKVLEPLEVNALGPGQIPQGHERIQGQTWRLVDSIESMQKALNDGQNNRTTASTSMNSSSSRSHMLVFVKLVQSNGSCSYLNLVDLAGSERIAKSEVQGQQLKEATFINKSLSSLGDVMQSLQAKAHHIPYRNSKLTQVLQDSLSGNSKVILVCQISPEEDSMSETLSSLNFAQRAALVELGQVKRNDSRPGTPPISPTGSPRSGSSPSARSMHQISNSKASPLQKPKRQSRSNA